MSERRFGRRPGPQTQTPRAPAGPSFQRKTAAFDEPAIARAPRSAAPEDPSLSVDDELREWKRTRKGFTIPWRQISLTASLCFGIASIVLPASVNRNVDYVLYALMGMSLYAGISRRLKI